MYKYPYGDSQQLNLDWILSKIKDMEAAEASDLETISKVLISLPYNTTTSYRRYDYAFLNGKLYRCLTDTSGVFNPTAWQEALIGDDLAVLTRWINAIDAAAVVDVKFDTTGTNGKIQQKYHDQYHDVVEVDYTPVQNSKRPLSSNAGYDLNGAIGDEATARENADNAFKTISQTYEPSISFNANVLDTANCNFKMTEKGGWYRIQTFLKFNVAPNMSNEVLISGLPTFDSGYQFEGFCIAGTKLGQATRFAINASAGTLISYYSYPTPAAGETWAIVAMLPKKNT